MGKEKFKELYVVGTKKFYGSVIRKQGGFFSLEEMYKAWKDWFDGYKYTLNEKGQSGKDLPSKEREEKIEWVAYRDVTSYVRFNIEIEFWVIRMSNVAVEAEGRKQILQKGDLHIGFKAYMSKDYRNRWKKSEFLRRMYDRFVVKGRLSMYEGKLWAEANELIALTKKYCGMMPLKKE